MALAVVLAAAGSALLAGAVSKPADAAGAVNGAIVYQCSDGDLCLINPDGSGFTDLGIKGTRPRWSPNGELIAYASGGNIYRVDPNGSDVVQLTDAPNGTTYQDPSFSFDSSKVLFDNEDSVFAVPVGAADSTPVVVSTGSTPALEPAQSPDGTSIAFVNGNGTGAGVIVFNSGTDSTQTGGIDQDPAWSPDGSRLYFDHLPSGGNFEIDWVTPGSTSLTEVIGLAGADFQVPAPSPDGTELAYSEDTLQGGIGIVNTTGSPSPTVLPGTLGSRSPSWQSVSQTYGPTLSTSATPGPVSPGASISDTATLAGAASGAVGTISFGAYSDSACATTPVATGTATVSGNGTYTFSTTSLTSPGTYYWKASYSGDATTNTYGASSACGASGETTTVGSPPTLTTAATLGPVAPSTTITDTATLSGTAARAAGSIIFDAYSDAACTDQVYTDTVSVSNSSGGSGSYSPPGFAPTELGTYYWTASYGGDPSTGTLAVKEACGGSNESTLVSTPGVWSGSGGATEPGTSTVVDNGSDGTAEFSYDVPNSCGCGVSGSWTFSTTASQSGQLDLPWSYTGFHAYFSVTAGLTAFVTHDGVTTTTSLVSAGPVSCSPCTPPSGGFAYSGTTTLSVQAGDTYGFTMSGGNFDSNATMQGTLTVDLVDNDSWTQAQPIALDGNGNGSASGSIDLSGQARWYKFNVTPGGSVQINLSNLPANYDLALFSDIGQAYSNLTGPSGLQTESAEYGNNAFSPSVFSPSVFSPSVFSPSVFSPSVFSPSVFSPSVFSPSVFSPSVFSPSVFSPSVFSPSVFSPSVFSPSTSEEEADYEGAQVQSLLAVSNNSGTAGQSIYADIWNNTGSFYIRVNGANGSYDPGAKFSLSVAENSGTCGGVAPSTAPLLSITPPGSSYQSLILADYSRMTDDGDLSTMETTLNQFAGESSVNGTIAQLDQISPQLNALYAQADQHADCPYAENLVADAIRNIVLAYRAANPGLKYVVLVGNDHVIPFFRYPDTAGIGPESDYVPPVLSTSPSEASLASNDVLSQDAYGATTVLDASGVELPVPDLPVGRLVDTPTEITGLLNAYTNGTTGGVVKTPTSSLVTGYDFMTSGADAVESDLKAGLGSGATDDTLITNDGVSPSQTGSPPLNSWTASQLETALLGSRHDLIFLAGHFSANNTLAADFSTTMNSTQLAASNVNLENSIVFSAGCHSGYNIVGNDAVPGVTVQPDWVEAFAQKQATLIAGTGYQYGDTDFLAYSEQLYANFAHALLLGSGPVSVGDALTEAKQAYLEATPDLQGIDIKSLLEATLYGLPMLSVNMPDGRIPTASSSSIVTQTTPSGTNPGETLGLSSADVTLSPTLTPVTTQLEDSNGNTAGEPVATYLEGPNDGVDTSPGAPTLPLATYDVGVGGGQVLRGVGFLGGNYSDQTGITPLTGAPGTELSGIHSTFSSSAFYPSKLWSVNYFDGLTDNGGDPTDAELMLTPAQYESDAPNSLTDDQRSFSSVNLRLFYSGNTQTYGTNTPALAAPPTISRVDASSAPDGSGTNTVTFSVHVVGDPSAGIQQAWITYTGLSQGLWQSLFLTQSSSDSTLWTGTLTGLSSQQVAALEFMVQAVNGVGLVAMDTNQGPYYQVNQIPPALVTSNSLVASSLSLAAPVPATSGPYGSSVSLSATLTSAGSPVVGQSVSFAIGGSELSELTNSSGVASVELPLVDDPGSYQIDAGFSGDATLGPASASTPFSIATLPTSLSIQGGGSVLVGNATGITATLTSGGVGITSRSVAFVLTPSGGGTPVIQTRITNLSGTASLGVVTAPLAGTSYTVQAYFGPGAPIALPADPVYQASASGTVQLSVTPLEVVSIARQGASPTNAASVSWAVSFNAAVTGVSAANFSLVQSGGLSGAGGLAVSGSGTSYTLTATTGSGNGSLGLNLSTLTGITDGSGDSLTAGFTGQVYAIVRAAPTATISFPLSGAAYKASSYAAGCSHPGVCGSASDPSGVASVKVSIRNAAGKYWNGSSFAATAQTFLAATLASPNATTTTWSYPLALPADGSYTLNVQTTDVLGNTQAAGSYAASSNFQIDTVSPVISFSGNKGSYGLLDTVSITCSVADAAPSSGIKTNPCTGFSISGPASSFKPGSNTLPSPALVATDNAGNSSAPATTTFTVTATTATLCQLTTQFAESSAKYQALSALQKKAVSLLATALCTTLSSITAKLSPTAVAALIKAYDAGVTALVSPGWLTSAQVATLEAFAATL